MGPIRSVTKMLSEVVSCIKRVVKEVLGESSVDSPVV